MSKSAIQEIEVIRAAAEAKIEALKQKVVEELHEKLKLAQAEVERIKAEIDEFSGKPTTSRVRSPKLVEGSDEWNKVVGQLQLVLKRYPEGLNGKEIAYKLGLTEAKAIKRIQPVIQSTLRREGQGVLTKFFLK